MTTDTPPMFAPYVEQEIITCPLGHEYPAMAGVCPLDPPAALWRQPAGAAVAALAPLPGYLQTFVDTAITYKPARAGFNNHAYGYDNRKLGTVNHIPVCQTLAQLDAYFTSGNNAGLTHFGNGRELLTTLEISTPLGRFRLPVSPVSQYLAIVGPVSPWAQGVINTSGNCYLPAHPIATRLGSGVPNGAYISNENVAMSGADGVTDPQFNSNVFLRAMAAVYFNHPINPDTQIWHGEIDRVNRCFDPGWTDLEDPMQDAARALIQGDPRLLRGVVSIDQPQPPVPPPHDYYEAYVGAVEEMIQRDHHDLARANEDVWRASIRLEHDENVLRIIKG
jgi:hypothetical protein